MSSKAETGKPQIVNTLLLTLAAVMLIGGVGAYYWFQDLAITQSDSGAAFFRFIKEADIERRKVVWPTHQETMQTALMVIIVTILISLMLAGIDWVLGATVRALVGG
jgi:preprotein translocase subunit SecE